jgi:hypothetical protein
VGFTAIAETQALEGVVGNGTVDKNNFISLHTADPGTTVASEVTGGAYTREQTNWPAPAASSVTGSSVTLDVPAGVTITHWGVWSAASGGQFIYGGLLPAPESFGSNGTYSVTPTMTAGDA